MTDERAHSQRRIPLAERFGRQLHKDGSIRSTVLSAAVHAGLVALLVWQAAHQVRYYDASEAPGPGGRGGGFMTTCGCCPTPISPLSCWRTIG